VVCEYYPFLALLLTEGTNPEDCFQLHEKNENSFELLQTKPGRRELSALLGKRLGSVDWSRFDEQLDAIQSHDVTVLSFTSESFPNFIRQISRVPPLLFCKGDVGALQEPGVAIVGSRVASSRGRHFARDLAKRLSEEGVTVTSGLARGIDTAAHRGALQREASTVAVVATGLDVVYPKENTELMRIITRDGCVVTEQLMGTLPQSVLFPLRNRLISGLSRMVVVVEATLRSGALVTAKWALDQGRDVGAVPAFPGDPRGRGVNKLIKEGAVPIEGIEDIFFAAPELKRGELVKPHRQPEPPPSAIARELLEALDATTGDADRLAVVLGRSVAIVQRGLLELEMHRLVARDSAGEYYRV